jgi:hypothetical protein
MTIRDSKGFVEMFRANAAKEAPVDKLSVDVRGFVLGLKASLLDRVQLP